MQHKSKNRYQFLKIIAVHLLIIVISYSDIYGENSMPSMYSLNKALLPKLEPNIYSTKKIEILEIFDFPEDNTIATNILPGTNAVTRIDFNDKKLKYKTVAKNFKGYVGGGDTTYMYIFNEEWIGYAQNRGFTLLNIKTKKSRYYSIAGDTNMLIIDIDVIDAEKWLFLFTIEIIPSGADQNPKHLNLLRIIDLSTSERKIIGEKMLSDKIDVVPHKGTLFFTEKNTIKAYNLEFEETSHPVTDVFNKEYKSEIDIAQLTFHPNYTFAVFSTRDIVTYSSQLFLIKWGVDYEKNKPNIVNILNSGFFYKFSYDGKWLLSNSTVAGKDAYIILPVDKELPHYLGNPIYLGDVPSFPSGKGSSAMTRNPSGLVVSDCSKSEENFLKKWDFTKAEKLIEKNNQTQP